MFELDVHTHTVVSGHAYSTLIENARVGREKGLKLMGVSDHAPKLPGGAHLFNFLNMRILPDVIEGIRVLKGIEANIISYNGDIDVTKDEIADLDYVIASLHIPCINPGSKKDNTKAMIGAMGHPRVSIIGHPDDNRYPKEFDEIVKAANYYNVLLEVNNTSLNPKGFRKDAKGEVLRYLEICEREQVKIICNSDAHFAYDVGEFGNCHQVIKEAGFPESLIINHNSEEFLALIKEHSV